MPRRLTTEDFIRKSRMKHGDKYDYSAAVYTRTADPITIICPQHGHFQQRANDHTSGYGCHMCAGTKKLTTEDFIRKSRTNHGDKYDYSNTTYVNDYTPVEIICPIHGSFMQRPGTHLGSKNVAPGGCVKCGGRVIDNTKAFVEKCISLFGRDTYDYSHTEYTQSHDLITVICTKHGPMVKKAYMFLSGHGCAKCSSNAPKTNKQFENESRIIHGDVYDYSHVEYRNVYTRVVLLCPKHGRFKIQPKHHLRGYGCRRCSSTCSKLEKEWLELISIPHDRLKRQHSVTIDGQRYVVDAYDVATNTIYEFLGDYWHGNPVLHLPDQMNKNNKTTFGELYERTFNRFRELEKSGFKIAYIWEHDFKKQRKDYQNFIQTL